VRAELPWLVRAELWISKSFPAAHTPDVGAVTDSRNDARELVAGDGGATPFAFFGWAEHAGRYARVADALCREATVGIERRTTGHCQGRALAHEPVVFRTPVGGLGCSRLGDPVTLGRVGASEKGTGPFHERRASCRVPGEAR